MGEGRDFEHLAELWLANGKLDKAAKAFSDRAKRPLPVRRMPARSWDGAPKPRTVISRPGHAKAASLYAKAGNDERLAACLFKMEEWRWLADVYERRGETAEAVAALKRWLEGGASLRRELEKELAVPLVTGPAHHAALLRAALGDSAESHALAGRFLDAALAVEASTLPVRRALAEGARELGRPAGPAGAALSARDALHEAAAALLAGRPSPRGARALPRAG